MLAAVVHRLATYIGRPRASREVAPEESVFRKLGNRTSVEWTARFNLEHDAQLRAAQAAQAAAATAGAPLSPAAPRTAR